MRKIFIIVTVLAGISYSQVFNDARVPRQGNWVMGISPSFYNTAAGNDMGLFLFADYGLGSAMSLAGRLGVGFDETYIGVEIERTLRFMSPYISVAGGLHSFGDIGIDMRLNFSFPLGRPVEMYTGLDAGLVFGEKKRMTPNGVESESDIRFLTWYFIGAEVVVQKNMTVFFETEMGLDEDAYNFFAVGIKFYL